MGSYHAKIGEVLQPKIVSTIRGLFSRYPILVSYLFGSQATQKANPNSDYDFAIMLSPKVLPVRYSYYKLRLITDLLRTVNTEFLDLVILNDPKTPLLLKFNIIKEGAIIYEKDKRQREILETDILLEWYDQQYFEHLWCTHFTKNLAQGKII